jgi:hypothetical protein
MPRLLCENLLGRVALTVAEKRNPDEAGFLYLEEPRISQNLF